MKNFLASRLRRVTRRHQWLRFSRSLTVCWIGSAFVAAGLLVLQRQAGWASPFAFPALIGVAVSVSLALLVRAYQTRPDERAIAQKIETAYPELKGLLLTAVQQSQEGQGEPGYLQHRLIQQAVDHCQQTGSWRAAVPPAHVRRAMALQFAALALFAAALWQGRAGWTKPGRAGVPILADREVSITPGDALIEKGESLVVLARFGGALPPGVELVVNEPNAPVRKIPLVKSLADPVFGGSVPEVAYDFTYRLDYRGERSRDFTVKTFEHPRLARADAELKYPAYTKQPPKRIEDTRRVTAVEGTQLTLTLQLNKPVVSATLVARNKEKTQIPLKVTADKAVAALADFPLAASQNYDLKLVDADGRANKVSAPFVIDVLPNRLPELKVISPRGDVRPSALEEIAFEGTVWDDFGSPAYGLAYTLAGKETKFIELGRDVPAKEKRAFNQLVRLEELGVKPDDLVSWYVWADDIGPDGKVRRTSSDMFFAEVRPFDEIFRESQAMQQEEQDQQQQQGQGNQPQRLAELQKQIISATWKLQREPATKKYPEDATVVHDSQQQALTQAKDSQEKARNPRSQALWSAVTKEMEAAVQRLDEAAKSPAPLAAALTAEQAAYAALLKLQARETDVTRNRRRGGQGGGGQQGNQRQLNELDLAQSDNRYETQRQAKSPQSPERREQNQVLNRLQELARRQQDVNERLKEMQTALQAANTEQEKEDVRRQLKRLQEEQQQMLADMDEMKQRMDRPENQSAMQQQRQQLEQTRDDAQKAADATAQGSVAQALASGTRAQRQLQQMRDDLRKQSSSEFADDLRQMRTEARDLAQQQEDVSKKIAALDDPKQKKLNDAPERQAAIDQLDQQKKHMDELVTRASQVAEQAESSEPLLARQLYDSVRKVAQDDAKTVKDLRQQLLEQGMLTRALNERLQQSPEKESGSRSLELSSELLRQGFLTPAGQASQRAGAGITDLKRGVERAAESVLGDDAQALKLAQSELDAVTDQLKRELAQGQSGQPGEPKPGQPRAGGESASGDQRQASNQPPTEGGNTPSNDPSGQPGAGGERTAGQTPGQPGQPGQARGNRGDPANRPGGQRQLAGNDRAGGGAEGGRGGGGETIDGLLNQGISRTGNIGGGPITGENFAPWADRLRDIEELVDTPALRDAVANARERARLLRLDFNRDQKKPDWAVVQLQILQPLVEVRARIGEELARRDSKDALVPIDRDPVPNRFADSVRRYYEELGKEK